MCRDCSSKLLSFLLTSWFANCAVPQNISAREGFTVVLPCKFKVMSLQRLYVGWRTDQKVVFMRLDNDSYQGEGYEGRVDVPEDELRKGNCSLVMKNISVTDAGIYRSYLKRFTQSVELSVDETPEKPSVSGDAGVNSPHPLVIITSLLTFLLFHAWSKELKSSQPPM
ncbi:programmed cell death 1 ligand 1-like isoform X1 [Tachysurus fulvidraco]|uniref:programmed cell death 1 ligand 1-like isoform X1 n=2 Tax=Tachysurus fulvidraco TaxID=1234273 RepID=UPI001FEF2DEB|nr:programmed cell death 1 ligand 1-like isoform X1 [Tachysurus fulvidraco]